jgi:hypothetical protein
MKRVVAAIAAAGALVAMGGPARAAGAVPQNFIGVVAGTELVDRPQLIDSEVRRMRAAGVRTVRSPFNWWAIEPAPGAYRWATTDRLVGAAAAQGIDVLPTVLGAPAWAAIDPGRLVGAPRRPADYGRFLAVAARRYGPGGAFWRTRPWLPTRPIRLWQIWNEPSVPYFWDAQPWPQRYVALLRAARRALRGVDPGARVMAAGNPRASWTSLDRLYAAGLRGLADVLAVHPFTRRPADVVRIVRLNRRVMRRWGDGDRPLAVTETSWPSARGKVTRTYGFEVTEAQQARLLRDVLVRLARARQSLRISAVYWFTWLSTDRDPTDPFAFSGLRTLRTGAPRDKPALRAFRNAVNALRS